MAENFAVGGMITRCESRPARPSLAWLTARRAIIAQKYLPHAERLAEQENRLAERVIDLYRAELVELDQMIADRQPARGAIIVCLNPYCSALFGGENDPQQLS